MMLLKVVATVNLLVGLVFGGDLVIKQFPDDYEHFNRTLAAILKPRFVGTPGHEEVEEFIKEELNTLGFLAEVDQYSSLIPIYGNVTFTNIIGILNTAAEDFLTFACHYDSKFLPQDPNFVAAIDSAVSCTILLNIAKTLSTYFQGIFQDRKDIGFMLIFFDNKDGVKDYKDKQSASGSSHLAEKYSVSSFLKMRRRRIDRIEVLVLLDLIGATNPKFYSFFRHTNGLHGNLVSIETAMIDGKLLEGNKHMFVRKEYREGISDDHDSFVAQKVSVLHIIPIPIPNRVNTPRDTFENLNWRSINNLSKILRSFTYEYLLRHVPKAVS